ncbi:hypothetical protein [Devosia sp.]|uniref:hypothetical protein n=1 Tax=Devosia sp. TaxID=1871048 RepID=UPI003A913881
MKTIALLTFAAIIALGGPATAACQDIASARVDVSYAFSNDAAGQLILRQEKAYYLLEGDCYLLEQKRSQKRAFLLVNNHLTSQEQQDNTDRDLAVQVLKLFPREAGQDRNFVKAYRSTGADWFRGRSKIGPYAANDTALPLTPEQWSATHGNRVLKVLDTKLRGMFHAQATPDGRNSVRTWWQLDRRTTSAFDVGLNNFLFKFKPASGPTASGIDFFVNPAGAQGLIIRYDSLSTRIEGGVRLCFGSCEGIQSLPIEPMTRSELSSLWHRIWPFG